MSIDGMISKETSLILFYRRREKGWRENKGYTNIQIGGQGGTRHA